MSTRTFRTKTHLGFSLTELVVVLAVIALIAAIAVPTFSSVRANTTQDVAALSARSLAGNAMALATGGDGATGQVTAEGFDQALGLAIGETPNGSTLGDMQDNGDGTVSWRYTHPNEQDAVITFDPVTQIWDIGETSAADLGEGSVDPAPEPAPLSQPFSWGYNEAGMLGVGTLGTGANPNPLAVDVSGVLADVSVVQVSGGAYHSVALSADGKVYSWGWGSSGQLGDGTPMTHNNVQTRPVETVMSGALAGKTVTQISAGYYHTLALTSDGQVYAWGLGEYGQLGAGDTTNRNAPVAVDMSGALAGKTVVQVSAGGHHSLAVTSDGQVYAWGGGSSGRLGNGASANSAVPVAVDTSGALAGKAVTQVSAHFYHSLALTSDGQLYAWGANATGQFGNGSTTGSSVPVAVDMSGALAGKTVTQISAGTDPISAGGGYSLALTSDGQVYAWGDNGYGTLGDGTLTNRSVPVAVDATGVLAGKTVTQISAGYGHSLALTSDGQLYAWGWNHAGRLGDGTTTLRSSPVAVNMTGVMLGWVATQVDASYGGFTLAVAYLP
jgi:prepilin-type N-terminal cleavage/methylation domain-containing protein